MLPDLLLAAPMKRLHKHNIPALRASRIAGLAIGVPLHQLTSGRPASSLPRLRGLRPLDASTRLGLTPCLRSPHFARLGRPVHRVNCPQQQYWSARKYLHVLIIASEKWSLEAIPASPVTSEQRATSPRKWGLPRGWRMGLFDSRIVIELAVGRSCGPGPTGS